MGCNDIEIRKSEFADENSIPLLNSDSGPQKTEIKKSKFVAKKISSLTRLKSYLKVVINDNARFTTVPFKAVANQV